ncbi:sensor histidine kinase [Aquimarina algicola]|uniref:GHKL domain-containing protein n=1 Tax=Aquimarina algicola TaxID=2589995 RepID=A0A504J7P3_9FLAO|nr:histidine kinase [Aquimarina algicola]TPN82171.1 GHKL domain-containing protein [Aquimarina algicola]
MSVVKSIYSWIVKYKVYHLVFWFLYHFSWWVVFKGGFTNAFDQISQPSGFVSFTSFIVIQAIGVYFCLYYLIPKYLIKSKYLMYVVLVIITIIVMASLILVPSIVWYYFFPLEGYQKFPIEELYKVFLHNTLPSSIGSMTLGMSIKLAKNWLSSQKKQQILEKEKLETELKFLKSQFNPHFLFNTINSIFVLINKNTDMATESLAKFSELLRYQLYECNEHQILLSKEISYIKGFIELEELRQNDNFMIRSEFSVVASNNLSIAPFLLMPFIENAFKHVSQYTDKSNIIEIKADLIENQFIFKISNTVDNHHEVSRDAVVYGGLGLKNVKRRLELLYPKYYDLKLNHNANQFSVELILNLEEYVAPQLTPYQL